MVFALARCTIQSADENNICIITTACTSTHESGWGGVGEVGVLSPRGHFKPSHNEVKALWHIPTF